MVLRARGCNYRHYAVTPSSRWFVISVVIAVFRRVSLKRKQREARRCDASRGQRAQTKQIRINSVLVFYLITVRSHLNEWKKRKESESPRTIAKRRISSAPCEFLLPSPSSLLVSPFPFLLFSSLFSPFFSVSFKARVICSKLHDRQVQFIQRWPTCEMHL